MRVKKASADEVADKLKQIMEKSKKKDEPVDFKARYEQRVLEKEKELEELRAAKREAKQLKK